MHCTSCLPNHFQFLLNGTHHSIELHTQYVTYEYVKHMGMYRVTFAAHICHNIHSMCLAVLSIHTLYIQTNIQTYIHIYIHI